ncbi:leucine carboxyl methyltransferase [Cristinia sonorae]|uniref:Leucine carboxyl methyltransferase 1 n=1 Tax=Cristinia sonorae TaxID=1940300 RepID=A0A8K0UG70_9AGAR|nr:leucine carboxyl methyltransferase [Cristinia sonorae]
MLPRSSFPQRFSEGQHERVDTDAAIRQTDSDAILARFSAVQKQYLQDPFVKPLLPRGAHLQPSRPPLINIGTYVRSQGIDALVDQWLALSHREGKKCQIVSLGAGSDTRFWRIATSPRKDILGRYIEIDFSENTTKKAMAIRKSKELSALLGQPEDVTLVGGGTGLSSPVYHLRAADLRSPPTESLASVLQSNSYDGSPLLDPSLPTLLLFECVLVYMTPIQSSTLIQWFVDYFAQSSSTLGGIVYEMFGLNDPFGKVMHANLKARHVELPGAAPYPTFASLPTRFTQHGFQHANAITLRDYRRSCVSSTELERISQLELVDEVEELELVLAHYAITWGCKTFGDDAHNSGWGSWGIQPAAS